MTPLIILFILTFGNNREDCVPLSVLKKCSQVENVIPINSLYSLNRVIVPNINLCYGCYDKEKPVVILRYEPSKFNQIVLSRNDKAHLPKSITVFVKKEKITNRYLRNQVLYICD